MSLVVRIKTDYPDPDVPVLFTIDAPERQYVVPNINMGDNEVVEGWIRCEVFPGFLRLSLNGAFTNVQPDPPDDPGITDQPGFDKQSIRHSYTKFVRQEYLLFFHLETRDNPAVVNLRVRFTTNRFDD